MFLRVFCTELMWGSDTCKSVQHDKIYLWSIYVEKLFSHVRFIALFGTHFSISRFLILKIITWDLYQWSVLCKANFCNVWASPISKPLNPPADSHHLAVLNSNCKVKKLKIMSIYFEVPHRVNRSVNVPYGIWHRTDFGILDLSTNMLHWIPLNCIPVNGLFLLIA